MAPYRIEGLNKAQPRLFCESKLSRDDFAHIAADLGVQPLKARKIGFIAARRATVPTKIETHWVVKETEGIAEPGDWIATNMTPERKLLRDEAGHLNIYVIKADRFDDLYVRDKGANAQGAMYRAISEANALFLAGGFDIMAPWGKQNASAGYLLDNGKEVYGNAKETFEATYQVLK